MEDLVTSKRQKNYRCFTQGKVPLWGPFRFLTSLGLPALGISNPEGPHSKTFSYTLFSHFNSLLNNCFVIGLTCMPSINTNLFHRKWNLESKSKSPKKVQFWKFFEINKTKISMVRIFYLSSKSFFLIKPFNLRSSPTILS